jgi:hypothetical protein
VQGALTHIPQEQGDPAQSQKSKLVTLVQGDIFMFVPLAVRSDPT